MSSLAVELANYLVAQGVGTRGGDQEWGIHVGEEPASPGNVITLYDTGGPGDLNIDAEIAQPTVQVRVRASDYEACYDKHQQIAELLVTEVQRQIGVHWYIGIWKTSDTLDLGRDANRRCRMTANFRTLRQPMDDTGGGETAPLTLDREDITLDQEEITLDMEEA